VMASAPYFFSAFFFAAATGGSFPTF